MNYIHFDTLSFTELTAPCVWTMWNAFVWLLRYKRSLGSDKIFLVFGFMTLIKPDECCKKRGDCLHWAQGRDYYTKRSMTNRIQAEGKNHLAHLQHFLRLQCSLLLYRTEWEGQTYNFTWDHWGQINEIILSTIFKVRYHQQWKIVNPDLAKGRDWTGTRETAWFLCREVPTETLNHGLYLSTWLAFIRPKV